MEILEEGAKYFIKMNRFSEMLTPGDIEGQEELIPQGGRDYVLQMIVSPTVVSHDIDKTKFLITLKRSGGWKLIAVPLPDEVKQKIENLDE